jgi:hypothetical protein
MKEKLPFVPRGEASRKKEIAERRNEIASLETVGWRSTGDLPFIYAHELGDKYRATTIQGRLKVLLDEFLLTKDSEYKKGNLKIISGKTLVSPALSAELKEVIRLRLSRKK